MAPSPGDTPAMHPNRSSAATVWRWIGAVGVLASAAVHLVLWFQGYRDLEVVGPLFLLNAAGGVVLAVAILVWRHWLPLLGGIGFGLLTLTAYVLSATVGFFSVMTPFEFAGTAEIVSAMADLTAIVGSGMAMLRERGAA
ncbi:hypothetical protein [Myceligenerans indicum]|uniref:DUF4383 domain-containing protein n=1 Tax=Myceligenerans indicum TaxID=2593663 RepID=A0ABS1LKN1_9MICO|nr:hypothetical protein [Myceligenerans indicum]MBL0886776.1 hypothetical protein [Myceligenerans indicum]